MFKLNLRVIIFNLYLINAISNEKISLKNNYGYQEFEMKSILFKESDKSHRMVEIIFQKVSNSQNMIDCFLYGDKKLADNAISRRSDQLEVEYVTTKELSDWADKCSELLIEKIKNGQIQKYYDKDFPEEYNNKIDRYFFDGLMVFIISFNLRQFKYCYNSLRYIRGLNGVVREILLKILTI